MSQTYSTETATDATVVDLLGRMTPEALARIGEQARAAAQATQAGIADMSVGTIRLTKDPADGDGMVWEEEEEVLEPTGRRILPAGLTDPQVWRQRRKAAAVAAGYHATRSPVYAWRVAGVAALGTRIGLRDAWSYVTAGEYGQLVDQVRRTDAGPEHIADLRKERSAAARGRRHETLTILAASGCTSYCAALLAIGQVWGLAMTVPALLPLLGLLYALGRREIGRRTPDGQEFTITEVPVTGSGQALLGAESITAAFRRAGVIKDTEEVALVGPVRAVEIHAAEAVVDLPGDLTVSALVAAQEKIAAAFKVEPSWIDFRSAGHPGRCRLWIAGQDPFAVSRTSPLVARPERTDVWTTGILIGYNRRGLPVHLRLRHVMALLGGMSRTGKGMLLRNLMCGLGLEPRVNLRLVAGAKPGEHRGYAPVCATFFGRRPERLIVLLDALLEEAYRREEYLEDQGRAKLGEEDLEEFPLEILVIDEYKQYAGSSLRLPDPSDPKEVRTFKAADRIAAQLEELAAFAAALNITVLVSTQDPDANTVPRGYKSNSGARVATRTGGPVQTNAILKDGATGAGLRAHDIPESLRGGAIVDIDGAPGELIRGFFIEDEKYDGAAPVIAAGAALREELGRAPGQYDDPIEQYLLTHTGESSVGGGPSGSGRPGPPADIPAVNTSGLLAEMLAVFAAAGDPDRLSTAEILAGLAGIDADRWSPVALGVGEDDQAAYGRTGGAALREEIDAALEGTGRELRAGKWSAGGGARGYYLAEIKDAARIAP